MLGYEDFKKIYDMLDNATPFIHDCAASLSCSEACCKVPEDYDHDMGMYMLPGEDVMHDLEDDWLNWRIAAYNAHDLPKEWKDREDPIYVVMCNGPEHCKRELRPIQCRTFPLTPYIDEDGALHIVKYPGHLPYTCPLITEDISVDKRFVELVYEAWSILVADEMIRHMVVHDSKFLHPKAYLI